MLRNSIKASVVGDRVSQRNPGAELRQGGGRDCRLCGLLGCGKDSGCHLRRDGGDAV